MDRATKELIEAMDYKSMLRRWRFAPPSDPMLQGGTGRYFAEVMRRKRQQIGNEAHVAASKAVGWNG
jgi:hypothetical protein